MVYLSSLLKRMNLMFQFTCSLDLCVLCKWTVLPRYFCLMAHTSMFLLPPHLTITLHYRLKSPFLILLAVTTPVVQYVT